MTTTNTTNGGVSHRERGRGREIERKKLTIMWCNTEISRRPVCAHTHKHTHCIHLPFADEIVQVMCREFSHNTKYTTIQLLLNKRRKKTLQYLIASVELCARSEVAH